MSIINRLNLDSIYMCKNPVLLRDGSAAIDDKQGWITKEDGSRSWQYINKKRVLLPVRCGKCEGCRKFQQDQWFCRLRHEHLYNSKHIGSATGFLTLTFNEVEYKKALSLVTVRDDGKKDYTELYRYYIVPLKKRLRAERGENLKFRFYATNEFGEERGRFHFHMLIYFTGLCDDDYISKREEFCRKNRYFRHKVKTFDNGKPSSRWQTNDEVFLQCKILRQWCSKEFRQESLESRLYNKWSTCEKHGVCRKVQSTHAHGEYGHVTFFITKAVGMIKYVTNYALKCIKDGITTYHRQSPAMGLKFAETDLQTYISVVNLTPFCNAGTWHGRSLNVPMPRFYVRKLANKMKVIEQFWKAYPMLIQKYYEKHLDELKNKLSLQAVMQHIGENSHFYDTEVIDMPDLEIAKLPDMPLYMCV